MLWHNSNLQVGLELIVAISLVNVSSGLNWWKHLSVHFHKMRWFPFLLGMSSSIDESMPSNLTNCQNATLKYIQFDLVDNHSIESAFHFVTD